jgi:membrane protease YdiL (CAAX protease family)
MSHPNKTLLFIVLFFLGFTGIASFLLVDLSAVVALVPGGTTEMPTITTAFKLLSLVQPTLLVALAVVVGVVLAPRVGLSAPAAEAFVGGGNPFTALRAQLGPGIVGGIIGGGCIVLIWALSKPFLMPAHMERIGEYFKLLPLPTRLLYGGVTEEVLLRWGFMTFVVWVAWRLLRKGQNAPNSACFVGAILVSSLVFAALHLPVAFLLFSGSVSLALVLFIIFGNSAFGVVGGYLYWKRGLESAIIAHMVTHLVLALASWTGAYF